MSNASEQEQRKHKTPDGKLLRFILARKAYPSFCLQPKKILAYPVPSAWPKNQPFPKKALSQINKWGSIINLTLQTKDALVLLQVKLALKTGASKKLQPAVYQRSAQLGCFLQAPSLPLPLIGCYLVQGLGHFKAPEACSMFSCEIVYFIYSESKIVECLHMRPCARLVKGLMLFQGIVCPRCQDSLLRPSESWAEEACSLPTTYSHPGRSYWPMMRKCLFFSLFKPCFRFFP